MGENVCVSSRGPEEMTLCFSISRDFCQETLLMLLRQIGLLEKYQKVLRKLESSYAEQGIELNIVSVVEGALQHLREAVGECLMTLNGSDSKNKVIVPNGKITE